MAKITGGQVDLRGGCETCGKVWYTKNTVGLVVQHADRYGHVTWFESVGSFTCKPEG